MKAPTARQHAVLRGIANGRSNIEIGRDLHLSNSTIKVHARELYHALGARDRAHAVGIGFAVGLLVAADVAVDQ